MEGNQCEDKYNEHIERKRFGMMSKVGEGGKCND